MVIIRGKLKYCQRININLEDVFVWGKSRGTVEDLSSFSVQVLFLAHWERLCWSDWCQMVQVTNVCFYH